MLRRSVPLLRPLLIPLLGCGVLAMLAGCRGTGMPGLQPTSSPPQQQPTALIFVAAPPKSMAVQARVTLEADFTWALTTVIPQQQPQVQWAASCGSPGACGTFSESPNANGVVYRAPAAIPAGGTVTVTASGGGLSVSATITIVPPIPISVSFFAAPPVSMETGGSYAMSASIANDVSDKPEVNWSVSCGSASCGSFSSTATQDEQQTTYTAPAAIPSGGTVTVTATSATDPTKSVSATLAITQPGPMLANGTYVFQINGSAQTGGGFTTGAFVARDGTITGGEQDQVDYEVSYLDGSVIGTSSGSSAQEQITGGSYGTTYDGNLLIALNLGPNATETIDGTLSASEGFVAGVDGAPASGTLELQTSTASPSGGYAIALAGVDQYDDPARIGGVLNVDSAGGISGAGSVLDGSAGPVGTASREAVGASTVSAPDRYGRVVIQLTPGAGSSMLPLDLAGYIVDGQHIRLIETDDNAGAGPNYAGVLGGTALGQGSGTGQFTTASVAGASYVFAAQGRDSSGRLQIAGVLKPASDGTLTGMVNSNDGSGDVGQSPVAVTGKWKVESDGRMTVTDVSDGANFSYSMHLYLAAGGAGLLVSSDGNDDFSGQVWRQQSEPFTAGTLSGAYGLNAMEVANDPTLGSSMTAEVQGPMTVSGTGSGVSLSGFADGWRMGNFAVSGEFTPAADGVWTGTLTGFDPSDRGSMGSFTLYLVDGTQGVLIETDTAQLVLGRVERAP